MGIATMNNYFLRARTYGPAACPKQAARITQVIIPKILTICICLALGIYGFSQPAKPVERALIFAIGDYPESGGWPKISSVDDVPYIQNVLINQGFLESNIKKVLDSNASIGGIKNAFEELIKSVNPGDVVVIHFSS